jgi:hypothetical protein
MEDLRTKIQRLTAELNSLESVFEPTVTAGDQDTASALDPVLLEEFKTCLDHMRHLVWPVLLALQQDAAASIEYSLQGYRMQRVRDMLGLLRTQAQTDPRTQLFLAELHRMTSNRSTEC